MTSKSAEDTSESFAPAGTAVSSESFAPAGTAVSSERLKDIAERALGETAELKEQCLQKLRTLIKDNNVTCVTGDAFLLRFLRIRKFHVERSFESLRNYAHHRVVHNSLLLKLKPQVMRTILHHNILGCLPHRDSEGRRVLFYRTGIWNPDICSDEEMMISILVMTNYIAEDESSQISGLVVIIDNKRFSFANMAFLMRHINFLKSFLLNCLPVRYSEIHVINEPLVIKYVVRLLQPFVPKKIMSRTFFHGKTREVLFQHIVPTILPDDFDGTSGPLNNDYWCELMADYLSKTKDEQCYFLEQNC